MSVTIDAVEINSLVARRPEKLLAVLERETLNGLWQLVLTDPEGRGAWQLGHYLDGYENREVELQDELAEERRVDASPGEIAWRGERMRIDAGSDRIRIEIGAWRLEYPLLCPFAQHPLDAPVWLGTTVEGRYFYLDCFSGFTVYPDSLEGLNREVYRSRCPQCGAIHWFEWRIVARGRIAVNSSKPPYGPNEVIEALRRALRA